MLTTKLYNGVLITDDQDHNPDPVQVPEEVQDYIKFLHDAGNSHACGSCPANQDMTSPLYEDRLPCGQYHCWVDMHQQ